MKSEIRFQTVNLVARIHSQNISRKPQFLEVQLEPPTINFYLITNNKPCLLRFEQCPLYRIPAHKHCL